MNRLKKHRVKLENAATSSSNSRPLEEPDLAYFIHDRVELMHQVFSVLKSKELKSLAPECVRQLSIDDLQELCLEELLGISSKRLCAILDGAEPPSDTESSSQSAEHLETISLDSISSDEEILSTGSSKKKKHKHRHGKKKRKKRKSSEEEGDTRASRAGLTVLELLELQARARAIRAQLHQEPPKAQPDPVPEHSSDNEVEIKEEPTEVVEISSDEEKPDVTRLQEQIGNTANSNETPNTNKHNEESQTVTRRINDLVITVPQSKPTRKIKLKRQKPPEVVREEPKAKDVEKKEASNEVDKSIEKDVQVVESKNKGKKNKKKKKKVKDKGSDEDEITLQLSDTEKMDLLEDLDAKNFDYVSSSDSDSSDDNNYQNNDTGQSNGNTEKPNGKTQKSGEITEQRDDNAQKLEDTMKSEDDKDVEMDNLETKNGVESATVITDDNVEKKTEESNIVTEIKGYVSNDNDGTVEINDLPIIVDEAAELKENVTNKNDNGSNVDAQSVNAKNKCDVGDTKESNKDNGDTAAKEQKSDGELSDRESSDVEASNVQPEVVCISDEESKKKKKKKKEKKLKKEKKDHKIEVTNVTEMTIDDDDDVYEILEISDDSSCYEVEGVSILSKEPTAEEIEAFSAKMDEIEIDNERVIPDNRVIPDKTQEETLSETCDVENVSWKDRYLGSKKVKRVLTTSNILNAIRKKNIELKKKLEEAKKAETEKGQKESDVVENSILQDGSIEQYETLQGSTKYVDPIKEKAVETEEDGETVKETEEIETNESVTKEMKKDAKMLLKMYKRLLKYNDIHKQKDPSKKKKKKQKKSKDKEKVKV